MLVFFDIGKVKRVLSASKTTTSKYLYIPDIYLTFFVTRIKAANTANTKLRNGTFSLRYNWIDSSIIVPFDFHVKNSILFQN
jgi:hypothetical protein